MSTNDVPGANPKNADELHMGCWAEHDDGSLIFVEGNENGTVVYSVFDLSKDPPLEYRDSMDEAGFEDTYSFNPDDDDSIPWTWHDKTPFPWGRIMKDFPDGSRLPSASAILTAAERVAQKLGLKARELNPEDHDHKADVVLPKKARNTLRKIQRAISELGI